MILTGDPIDAAEAHRVGLVNRVLPLPQLLPEAVRVAGRIAACGPLAVRAARASVLGGLGVDEAAALRQEFRHFIDVLRTEDAVEGATSFSERRTPRYRGR